MTGDLALIAIGIAIWPFFVLARKPWFSILNSLVILAFGVWCVYRKKVPMMGGALISGPAATAVGIGYSVVAVFVIAISVKQLMAGRYDSKHNKSIERTV